ncbi:hypothetical protein GCM10010129_06820 [Streptomyces fumigatiscleroticus]|nr:hypothetical protein GCM10010129_06820 [Streptomyces fumigatiscleroticus]
MAEALGEHGPVPHRDHGDEQKRKQTQDPADRDATGESSRAEFGELYRSHVREGSPHRTNGGLRKRGRRLTARGRLGGARPRTP